MSESVATPVQKKREAMRPLEAVQIDHAQVDAVAVDGETGDELGRPWLSLAFDSATRVVTGFYLSLAPPTRVSTGLALLHSVCDKSRWLKERGLSHDWPVGGLPETVFADPNSFFGARMFLKACRDAGIGAASCAGRGSRHGKRIESMIGDRLGETALLRDPTRDEREPGGGRAAPRFSLREMERWIGAQIAGDYHLRRHAALRRAPLAEWLSRRDDAALRTPADCVRFRLSFLPEEPCALDADGVRLQGRTYWSRALADDVSAGRPIVAVKYDPRDPSRVFVKRPSGRFVKAHAATECGGAADGSAAPFGVCGLVNAYHEASAVISLSDADRNPAPLRSPRPEPPVVDELLCDGAASAGLVCARKCNTSCPFQAKCG
jgi:putative transposase